jgi:hypothetical protein
VACTIPKMGSKACINRLQKEYRALLKVGRSCCSQAAPRFVVMLKRCTHRSFIVLLGTICSP